MVRQGFPGSSLGFDSENIVTNFHEGEHINLGRDRGFLRLCEMEFGVCKGSEGYKTTKLACQLQKEKGVKLTFAALILADVTRVLQVVKGEDVLHLSLSVDNGAGAVLHACFDLLAQELLHVVWLLVGEKSCQVLKIQK